MYLSLQFPAFSFAILGTALGGIYTIEVKLEIRKYSKTPLIAKVGLSATLGALLEE